jgi:hypothetical protein
MSLRQLMMLVAAVAVAIVSLKYASDAWLAIVAAVAMLAFFAAVIVAAVDRGPRQAFAIGFALTVAVYALVVMNGEKEFPNGRSRNIEFDQWDGKLPTTRLLRYMHIAVDHGGYYDRATGQEIPDYDPATDPNRNTAGGGFGGGGLGGGGFGAGPRVAFRELPPRESFMPVGHLWLGLLLGYLGGLFAVYVYSRRMREQKSLAAQSS